MSPVSVSLQAIGKDLVHALAEIKDMLKLLEELHSYDDLEFDEKIFQETRKIASKINEDKDILEIKPRTDNQSVYRANVGPKEQTAADYFWLNVFYPLLDAVITDIKYFLYLEKESTVKGEFQLWQKKVCKVSTSYKGWQKKTFRYQSLEYL